MILGLILAYQLQVGVGDQVTVMIPGNAAVRTTRSCRVCGTSRWRVSSRSDCKNSTALWRSSTLQDAEAFRGLAGPTGIRLKFYDVLKRPSWRATPPRGRAGLAVRDWTEDNEAYFRAIRIEKTMMGLILMLIVAVAVFNIVATLVMVVNDKRTTLRFCVPWV